MSKLLRAIFTPNLCLVGIVLGVAAFLVATIPLAHAAELPTPPQTKQPEPQVKLYYYPKLLPPQKGEEIIMVPHVPLPEDPLPDNLEDALKDPRTWA